MCTSFTWILGDIEYVTDVFIVPLGSCDMVLGVQWLATLGSNLWNFEELTMEFSFRGRRHLLQGIKKAAVEWPPGNEPKNSLLGLPAVCNAHYSYNP